LILAAVLFHGCGGGSGGKSDDPSLTWNGGSWESNFFLEDIRFGRPIFGNDGTVSGVINPVSHVEIDPITGSFLPGYPKLLFPGDSMGNLWSLNLVDTANQPFSPKIVPRNAVLVVDFSQPVDPDSLRLDANLCLTADSPIQIVDRQGRSTPIAVTIDGDQLILSPLTGERAGFGPSPVIFNEWGEPISDPQGNMRFVVYSIGTGDRILESAAGLELGARADRLGTPMKPIGFNTGNRYLDFVSFEELSFNGFLPDLSQPRIVRGVSDEGTIGGITPDGGSIAIDDPDADFETAANNGDGEYAAAIITVRPGEADQLLLRVLNNDQTTMWIAGDDPGLTYGWPQVGDAYVVQRVEYFEPINDFHRPETAVDRQKHPRDPNDPEDYKNSDLINFLSFSRWTGTGWEPIAADDDVYTDPDHPIGADWRIEIQFSEPMDVASFKPFDTFYVADDIGPISDPLLSTMRLGRIRSSNKQTTIYFEPVHTDQFGAFGGDRFVGFGSIASDLRFVIRAIPPVQLAEAFYESLGDPTTWPPNLDVVEDLEWEGVEGVTDLGGQPLGMPSQFFCRSDPYCIINEDSPGRGAFPPAIDFVEFFTCSGDSDLDQVDSIVQRFMGIPETAADQTADPPITGVVFRDCDDGDETHTDNEIYGPHISDVNLSLSGFLSGHPVEFIEHVFDDHNHPGPSSPSYPDPITKTPFGTGSPINCTEGIRFQQVYRRGDASPDVDIFSGTILDLVGLAWSPIGGNVTSTYIREMSIAVALSSMGIDVTWPSPVHDDPNTIESGGIPASPTSGLRQKFDSYRGTWGPYKETDPPLEQNQTNVWDSDGDDSVRDEWVIVLGDPLDLNKLNSSPPQPYGGGRSYFIDQSNRYAPKNQGSKFNYYISYPGFDNPSPNPGFPYDSSRGLAIEIRTDPQHATVALSNGYAFCAGIMSSQMPRFRIFARGGWPPPPPPPPYNPFPPPQNQPNRAQVFAVTDPYDEINPPVDAQGEPDPERSWNRAWRTLPTGSWGLNPPQTNPFEECYEYGDNSRYFMIFNYAKRLSLIESPWLRVKSIGLPTPAFLAPVIVTVPQELAPGTNLEIWFRAAQDENGAGATGWVEPGAVEDLNDGTRPFIQFNVIFEGNLQTSEIPMIDTVVIPYIQP